MAHDRIEYIEDDDADVSDNYALKEDFDDDDESYSYIFDRDIAGMRYLVENTISY